MKDILEKLYCIETEENPQLIPNRQDPQYLKLQSAYDTLFEALNEEQKKLFLSYCDIRGAWVCKESALLYKTAFQSGFLLAEELYKTKNE